jgi:hypothetical protein
VPDIKRRDAVLVEIALRDALHKWLQLRDFDPGICDVTR